MIVTGRTREWFLGANEPSRSMSRSRQETVPIKMKTHVRAGQGVQYAPPGDDHCRSALWDLYQHPTDGNRQRRFCDCCARDPRCLY